MQLPQLQVSTRLGMSVAGAMFSNQSIVIIVLRHDVVQGRFFVCVFQGYEM